MKVIYNRRATMKTQRKERRGLISFHELKEGVVQGFEAQFA